MYRWKSGVHTPLMAIVVWCAQTSTLPSTPAAPPSPDLWPSSLLAFAGSAKLFVLRDSEKPALSHSTHFQTPARHGRAALVQRCGRQKKSSNAEDPSPAGSSEPKTPKSKKSVPKRAAKARASAKEAVAAAPENKAKAMEPLMKEFAMKATVLLREAGGQMDSATFRKRWKFNFPMDSIDRYKQGRRMSVRQLMQRCGELFAVQDIDGHPRNKLFVLRGEDVSEGEEGEGWGGLEEGPWIEWSGEVEESASSMEAEEQERFREGAPTLVPKLARRYISPSARGEAAEKSWEEEEEGGWGEEEEGSAEGEEQEENCVLDGSCCELAFGDTVYAEKALKGISVLEEMATIGITFGNVVSYNALLHACAQAANEESAQYATHALNLLARMEEAGVAPSVESYTAAMKACCKSKGGLYKSSSLLQQVRERGGVKLPVQTYNLILDTCTREAALLDSKAIQLSLSVLEMLKQDGVMPDSERCLALIAAVPPGQEWTHWSRKRVVELMEESGLEYSAVMQAHQLANDLNQQNSDS